MGRLSQQFATKVSLAMLADKYGKLWKDAYIEIAPLTMKQLPELRNFQGEASADGELTDDQTAQLLPMVKKGFVGGKIVFNDELVDAEADDLDDLPVSAASQVIVAAVGATDPK